MATLVATDGENIFWVDDAGLHTLPANTTLLSAQVDDLQKRVGNLESGIPNLTSIDSGTF